MACTSVAIPGSPRSSRSSMDLLDRSGMIMKRSRSEPQLIRCLSSSNQSALQAEVPKLKSSNSMNGIFPFQISTSMFPSSVKSFLFDTNLDKDRMAVVDHNQQAEEEVGVMDGGDDDGDDELEKRANWVERLLELRSRWMNRHQKEQHSDAYDRHRDDHDRDDHGECEVDYDDQEEESFDREKFSRLLVRVPFSDVQLFSQFALLCNMAYVIPEIKTDELQTQHGLRFVTSSLHKKAEAALIAKLDQDSTRVGPTSPSTPSIERETNHNRPIRSPAAYDIAASAASYVRSRAKHILALAKSSHTEKIVDHVRGEESAREDVEGACSSPSRLYTSEMAAYVAASTMTAVVAAEETARQQAAKDLQSLHSSPCEWFVCEDPDTCTLCFVTQGSDSLASWQANLFFEPTKFEETEVFVHRGIYEAAKGIYEQFMPEIQNHLQKYGERAKLRFVGHSLGGSLSLLVHLMLLSRGAVKASALLPVVTFGSPFIFCGGQRILDKFGLDESNVLSVMMHRDIVPRAFSCNYPNHVAQILKRLNGSFRSHPCLNNKKMLYTPLGQLFILQPDAKSSPPHPWLPRGSALYALDMSTQQAPATAVKAFLNNPHPLETLSDPTAYGSEGTILRDHDSSNYMKATTAILRRYTKYIERSSRRERLYPLWPVLTTSQLTQQLPRSWSLQENLEKNGMVIGKKVVSGAA
ncbi:hypothetical protein Scep_006045 [Stephania cephalantha]|uniref:Fungal lipase-type domain-containing protein n=1 Tax=Stephania cephalantha TaxID=152367 RepID=A0AAP0K920_9MAGN